ncbi:MAG: 4Fe-4S binding protein [Methanoregulaceae archaeon]|nr:4Fe-4S binding protein [Methanoregulaceae archaeon]
MIPDTGVHMKGGVITERDEDHCIVRTRIAAGVIPVSRLKGLAGIAEKYGCSTVHVTTRQTIELPHVDSHDLEPLAAELEANGTPIGSERDEVVNVVACPGVDRCRFGNIDTIGLAQKIDSKLFGKDMPVKIRISISGCPNACTSPMLNEIGVIGKMEPVRIPGQCTGCGTCLLFCKEGAIAVRGGISVLDPDRCVRCGICVRSCPFHLLESGGAYYLVTVGGRRGRHPRIGREFITLTDEDQVVEAVARVVNWVYRRAWSGRLLAEQMDDLRFDEFRAEIEAQVAKKGKDEKPGEQ